LTTESNGFVERYHRTLNQECLKLSRPKTLDEVRQVTEAFATHSNWQRPHQGISCGNRPPRVAFPTLPSLPSVPDLVNPDAPFGRVKGQHLVRRVNRQGFVKVDLYPYYLSSKLAGQRVTLSIQATEQSLQVVYPQEYRRSLPRVWLAPTSTALSGVSSTHAARSLHANLVCLVWGGGKSTQTDRLLHTMQGNRPSDEVGKSYTHPVGHSLPRAAACLSFWNNFLHHSRDTYATVIRKSLTCRIIPLTTSLIGPLERICV